jgi:hypothetical protein
MLTTYQRRALPPHRHLAASGNDNGSRHCRVDDQRQRQPGRIPLIDDPAALPFWHSSGHC